MKRAIFLLALLALTTGAAWRRGDAYVLRAGKTDITMTSTTMRELPALLRRFGDGPYLWVRLGSREWLIRDETVLREAVELWAPIASLLREHRRSHADFPDRVGYLKADPARVAHWKGLLADLPGPKVGLLWKSLINKDHRDRFFSPFRQWEPVLKTPGVTFVNLQYGDCEEEIAFARRELGVEIWTPPGIDLKQDLDDVAALSSAMDLVLATAGIAARIFRHLPTVVTRRTDFKQQ